MSALRPTLTSLFFAFLLIGGTTSAWSAIIDGQEVKRDEFPEVYSVSYSYPGKLCTAVLIHPSVLLTSARCLPTNGDSVFVSSGNDAENPLATFPARTTYRFPDFDLNKDELTQASSDIGLIVLAEPHQGVQPVAPASLTDDADRSSAFFAGLTVVGYGGTRTLYADSTTGVKRWAGTHALESTFSLMATSGPTSGLSYGDQGGPAYITDVSTGLRRLIGVASGIPRAGRTLTNGIPEVSLYSGMRPEVVKWIEETTGVRL